MPDATTEDQAPGTGDGAVAVAPGGAPGATGTEPQPESSTGGEATLLVWRGDATGGDFVEYRVPFEEGEVVLDVIHRLAATQAPDLAVRWNCKAGKCGSCSAEVNGRPVLQCMARMS
ncbi:MAG TPA: 2Fe-2S iron-sulfur cluster-binding protein, partial [Acidimicrobiales bacterium]|nr:2Fe-2S iron-sulfur cluster-binding protein [Acidimicrobiales bacterium]